ncbi:MAG: hypothetical protein M3198_05255 [Actinomycetota bacterium]|nr:hypothetical protein [Actinomycetota bacterium]
MILGSPILRKPFKGIEAATELFEILFDIVGEMEITHEFHSEGTSAFFWRGDLNGRVIQGTDLITTQADGKISEITVLIRPLVDIAIFAAAIGPPLARRRGRLRGALTKLLSLSLPPLLRTVDLVASRLAQG